MNELKSKDFLKCNCKCYSLLSKHINRKIKKKSAVSYKQLEYGVRSSKVYDMRLLNTLKIGINLGITKLGVQIIRLQRYF